DLAFTTDGHLIRTNHEGRVKIWDGRPLAPEIEFQEQAASLVSGLIGDVVLKAEVIERIKADGSLRAPVHDAALAIAERSQEDAWHCNEPAWKAVQSKGRKAAVSRLALRQAQAACSSEPDSAFFLTTLGVAQYRQGQFAEAAETLARSDTIISQPKKTVNLA